MGMKIPFSEVLKMDKLDKPKVLAYLKDRLKQAYKVGFTDKDDEIKEIKQKIHNLENWDNINYVNYNTKRL